MPNGCPLPIAIRLFAEPVVINTPARTNLTLNRKTYQRLKAALTLNLRRQVFIGVCDNFVLRDRLAAQLQNDLLYNGHSTAHGRLHPHQARLVSLYLDINKPDPIAGIIQWLRQNKRDRSKRSLSMPAFQLLGVEHLSRQPAAIQWLFLNYLQGIERSLPALDSSLLVWVPRPWARIIPHSAPDFWRCRTAVFEFEGEPTPLTFTMSPEPSYSYTTHGEWSASQRQNSVAIAPPPNPSCQQDRTLDDCESVTFNSADNGVTETIADHNPNQRAETFALDHQAKTVESETFAPSVADTVAMDYSEPSVTDTFAIESSELSADPFAMDDPEPSVADTFAMDYSEPSVADTVVIESPEPSADPSAMDDPEPSVAEAVAEPDINDPKVADIQDSGATNMADGFTQRLPHEEPNTELNPTVETIVVDDAATDPDASPRNPMDSDLPDDCGTDAIATDDVTDDSTTEIYQQPTQILSMASMPHESQDSDGTNENDGVMQQAIAPLDSDSEPTTVSPDTTPDTTLLDDYDSIEQDLGIRDESSTLAPAPAPSVESPLYHQSPIPVYNPTAIDSQAPSQTNSLARFLNASLTPLPTGQIEAGADVVLEGEGDRPNADHVTHSDTEQSRDHNDLLDIAPLGLEGFDVLDSLDAITDHLLADEDENLNTPILSTDVPITDHLELSSTLPLTLSLGDELATDLPNLPDLPDLPVLSLTNDLTSDRLAAMSRDRGNIITSDDDNFDDRYPNHSRIDELIDELADIPFDELTDELADDHANELVEDFTSPVDLENLIKGLEEDGAVEEIVDTSPEELAIADTMVPDVTDGLNIAEALNDEDDRLEMSEALDVTDALDVADANDGFLVPDLIVAEDQTPIDSDVATDELLLFDATDPSVQPLLQQIEDLQRRRGDRNTIAETYRHLGNLYRDRIEQGDLSPQNLIGSMRAYRRVLDNIDNTHSAWAEVLNDMGNLCWLLSRSAPTIDQGLPHLQQGIASYRMALSQITPQSHPQTYPMIQNNLGAAYGDLARYQAPVENLQHSIHAYQEALLYRSVERYPLRYGSTQNNLGTTYWNLAQHVDPVGNLKNAIAAYSEALRMYRPDADPINYAMVQNNLGTTYWNLAQHEQSGDWLRLAIMAYETALRYRTVETNPAAFAATQNNLGTAYWHLASYVEEEAEPKLTALEKAEKAYDAAIAAVNRVQHSCPPVPLNFDVLATHNNLGLVQYQMVTESAMEAINPVNNSSQYLNAALDHHLIALRGWSDRPELRQTALGCVIQALQALYNQNGLTAQNLALSKIPGHLLPEIMPKL